MRTVKAKKRSHELVDPEVFLTKVNKLMSAKAATTSPEKVTEEYPWGDAGWLKPHREY